MMTGRKFLSPPLLALAPQSDHGSAACAETEAFFQYGPPQSFFELSWLALQKERVREVGARTDDRAQSSQPPSDGSLRNPDHGSAACAETEAFFQYGAAILFRVKLARPTKSMRARSWRNDDDRAQISKPFLLWLALQSDHGSAACAETEAFFPKMARCNPFSSLTQLVAPQKSTCAGRKFLSPPSYG